MFSVDTGRHPRRNRSAAAPPRTQGHVAGQSIHGRHGPTTAPIATGHAHAHLIRHRACEQTCPAPTARPATPGRGCHRPPRPTFAVTVQEHLNSTQDHQKVCTSPPNLSSVFRNSPSWPVLLFSCKETTPFIASLHSDAISLLQRREVQRLSPLTGSQYPLKSSKSCDLRAHSPGFVYLSVCVLAFVRANVHDLCTVRVHAWQCCIARRTGTSTYGCACGCVRAGVRKLQLKSCFPMVCKICAWACCVRFLSGSAL